MKEKISSKVKAHTRYKLKDGTIVPGASTICGLRAKPQLVKWANNLGLQGIDSSKYTDEKADVGTLAHYRIMCHLTNQKEDLTEYSPLVISQSDNCLLSFFEWEKKHEIKLVFSEKDFISEEMKFGGCIDILAYVDGILELIDLKTGKAIYDNYFVQLAGYDMLLSEAGYKVINRRILNIPRAEDECFVEKIESDSKMIIYKNIFKSLLNVYYCEKQLKGE
jgi:hypothetical protein